MALVRDLRIGDRVNVDGVVGTVLFVTATSRYCKEFPESYWQYLDPGFMFETSTGLRKFHACYKHDEVEIVDRR